MECYGNKCWSAIADQLPGRVAKQCRERYPEACAPPLPPPSPTQPPHRRCPVSRPAFCLFLSTHQAPSAERARRWLKQVCPSVNNEEWTDAEENRVVELVICPPPRPLLGPIGQLSSLLGPTVAWIQELSRVHVLPSSCAGAGHGDQVGQDLPDVPRPHGQRDQEPVELEDAPHPAAATQGAGEQHSSRSTSSLVPVGAVLPALLTLYPRPSGQRACRPGGASGCCHRPRGLSTPSPCNNRS